MGRRSRDEWLPSTADGDFIQSLMKPVLRARQIRRLDRAAQGRHRQQARRFRICEAAYGVVASAASRRSPSPSPLPEGRGDGCARCDGVSTLPCGRGRGEGVATQSAAMSESGQTTSHRSGTLHPLLHLRGDVHRAARSRMTASTSSSSSTSATSAWIASRPARPARSTIGASSTSPIRSRSSSAGQNLPAQAELRRRCRR